MHLIDTHEWGDFFASRTIINAQPAPDKTTAPRLGHSARRG
jgi:hypothetical protein